MMHVMAFDPTDKNLRVWDLAIWMVSVVGHHHQSSDEESGYWDTFYRFAVMCVEMEGGYFENI